MLLQKEIGIILGGNKHLVNPQFLVVLQRKTFTLLGSPLSAIKMETFSAHLLPLKQEGIEKVCLEKEREWTVSGGSERGKES